MEKRENLPALASGDGFDDLENDGRLIQGAIVKFNALDTAHPWSRSDGSPIADRKFLPVATHIVLQHWRNQRPIETIVKEPGVPLPDIDELNAQIPQETWEMGFDGKTPRPPWQRQVIVNLVDPETAERVTFCGGTVGADIAVRELKDAIALMRRLRNDPRAMPLVKLSSRTMRTKYGPRPRPAFEIVSWHGAGGEPAQLENKAAMPIASKEAQQRLAEMKKRVADDLDDEIPF